MAAFSLGFNGFLALKCNYMLQDFNLGWQSLSNGFKFLFTGRKSRYWVLYPRTIWQKFPAIAKKILANNYLYARTRSLSLISDRPLVYRSTKPALAPLIDFGIRQELPDIALYNELSLKELRQKTREFSSKRIDFLITDQQSKEILPKYPVNRRKVLLPLSFGKESLLSYALLKELGLDVSLCYCREMPGDQKNDIRIKIAMIKNFNETEGQKVTVFEDSTDEFFKDLFPEGYLEEADNTNVMLSYALEVLPIAYQQRCGWLALGNEQDFSHSFANYGLKTYSSFDQSAFYTKILNTNLKNFTNNQIGVFSPVEPLFNLAEVKLLLNRYSRLLPYITSCHYEERGTKRWCYNCRVCAETYLYAAAWGDWRQQLDFKRDMFDIKFRDYYPVLAKKITNPSLMSKVIRDQQLLAFLLAYRRGWSGGLMEIFKKKFLAEAERREKGLRKTFLRPVASPNIPSFIRPRLFKIFKAELGDQS